jgi:AP-1 complex subunit beta-1
VANACASLLEISNSTGKNYFKFSKGQNLNKILSAVNESNEWGQIFILEAISTYDPQNADEADQICERILPRLSHNNPAVLMSAIKVLLKNVDFVKEKALR